MVTTFSVDWERLVDGEYEPETTDFAKDEKDKALKFAREHYRPISYIVEDETNNYKLVDCGFVTDDGTLISEVKR